MGTARTQAGDLPAARAHYEAVLQAWTRTLGPDHPDLALIHSNLGALAFRSGDIDEALTQARLRYDLRASVRARSSAPGWCAEPVGMCPDPPSEPALALAMYRRAMAIRTAHLPPDHADLAHSHSNLASALYALGAATRRSATTRGAGDHRAHPRRRARAADPPAQQPGAVPDGVSAARRRRSAITIRRWRSPSGSAAHSARRWWCRGRGRRCPRSRSGGPARRCQC
ncbi:tetratricopeptide repeat protein [Nannocystis sp.]|uniref:tetratricopeptide repeat protein n=1 Tax=Nannocystis sp. TaxID=1962667 RepID=UPI00344C23E6|nr:tetratricopeptide repeat protein [Nannocystis sp.]